MDRGRAQNQRRESIKRGMRERERRRDATEAGKEIVEEKESSSFYPLGLLVVVVCCGG
jgi:hypothetical protein